MSIKFDRKTTFWLLPLKCDTYCTWKWKRNLRILTNAALHTNIQYTTRNKKPIEIYNVYFKYFSMSVNLTKCSVACRVMKCVILQILAPLNRQSIIFLELNRSALSTLIWITGKHTASYCSRQIYWSFLKPRISRPQAALNHIAVSWFVTRCALAKSLHNELA
jgi:hypothetical protein